VNYILKGDYDSINEESIGEFGIMLRSCFQIPILLNKNSKIKSWTIKTN